MYVNRSMRAAEAEAELLLIERRILRFDTALAAWPQLRAKPLTKEHIRLIQERNRLQAQIRASVTWSSYVDRQSDRQIGCDSQCESLLRAPPGPCRTVPSVTRAHTQTPTHICENFVCSCRAKSRGMTSV